MFQKLDFEIRRQNELFFVDKCVTITDIRHIVLMYLRLRHISCALDFVKINTQENLGMEAPVKTATLRG